MWSTRLPHVWCFAIQSSVSYVPWLRQFVSACAHSSRVRLSAQGVWRSTLSLVEAVNNAVIHAHKRDPSCWITLQIAMGHRRVHMIVQDRGTGFRLPKRKVPALHRARGRGLYLMQAYCTHVSVRRAKGTNVVRMNYEE